MPTTTNHYDVIVLGADIAGLVAAALIARRGKRVLVLPHGQDEGVYRLAGRMFPVDTAPVVHMRCPSVLRVFQELGLLQQVRREHAVIEGLLHYVLPRNRLDVEPGEGNFLEEAARTWPDAPVAEAWNLRQRWSNATTEILDDLLASENSLVAEGFWSRRFLGRVSSQMPSQQLDEFEPLPAEHEARQVGRAHEPWLQHLSPLQLGKAASLRLAGLWSRGPDDVAEGGARIRQILAQRIELHSGEVKREHRVAEILVRRGRIMGVSLLGKDERYGCDHMIIATDPRQLLDGTFVLEEPPRPLTNTLDAIDPVAFRYVLHGDIPERRLSPALSSVAICIPPPRASADRVAAGFAGHGAGMTYLRVRPGPHEGVRTLSITRILAPDDSLIHAREMILDDLDERGVLPFARDYISLLHSPHDGREATDGSGRIIADLATASTMTLPMAPLYAVRGEPSLGVGVLPYGAGIKHVYFASRLSLPGLGMEGEFAAGIMAAGLVAGAARTPFSRSPLLKRA